MSMKDSNDTIGTRNRDCPACSVIPQPTEPPPPFKSIVGIQRVTTWSGLMWPTLRVVDVFVDTAISFQVPVVK